MGQVRAYSLLQEMEEAGTMSNPVHAFADQESLINALSESIASKLRDAIQKNGKASLLVSGGNTPKPLFLKLSETELAWDKVNIGLCDERWVPASHEDSNENLVKKHLIQGKAKKAGFVGMYHDGMSNEEAQEKCSQTVREKLYPFDVVILGMGNDAHTASLFPDNEKLQKAFDLDNKELCIAVVPKDAPHDRMSLTRAAILSADNIYLHFEGKDKLLIYEKAIEGEDMNKMPIRSILNQNLKDVEVYFT